MEVQDEIAENLDVILGQMSEFKADEKRATSEDKREESVKPTQKIDDEVPTTTTKANNATTAKKTKRKVEKIEVSPMTKKKKVNEKQKKKGGDKPKEAEKEKSADVTQEVEEKKGNEKQKKKGGKGEQINQTKEEDKSKVKKGKEQEKAGKGKKKKEEDDEDVSVKKGGANQSDDKSKVLDYLISQNRPYSLLNIFDNLHGSIKKKPLERILDQLVEEKEIICKEYNSKIYLAGQHHFPEVDQSELKKIDEQLDLDRETITQLKQKLQSLQSELKLVNTQMTDEELDKQIKEKSQIRKELEGKLSCWEGGAIQKVPDEEVDRLEKDYELVRNKYKKHKKVCLGIIDTLCEGIECKREELYQMVRGFEPENDLYSKLNNKNI